MANYSCQKRFPPIRPIKLRHNTSVRPLQTNGLTTVRQTDDNSYQSNSSTVTVG